MEEGTKENEHDEKDPLPQEKEPPPIGTDKKEKDPSPQEKKPSPTLVTLRKTTRSTAGVPPKRFRDEYGELTHLADPCVFLTMDIYEPTNLQEAMESPNAQEWWKAAQAEYDSLIENEKWEVVPLPEGIKTISCKVKRDKDGNIDRYKGRLVVRGFSQKNGIDYFETFSPVVRLDSIRALLAFAVQKGMNIHQMDVVTAFLNSHLDEEIYMEQPEDFIESGKEHLVC